MSGVRFRAGGRTEIGSHRRANEDHLLIDSTVGLCAVFDAGGSWGDGPSRAGAVGADIIQRTIREGLEGSPDPRTLIERAFRTASETFRTQPDEDGCAWGASVALALVRSDRVFLSWLGDAMTHRVTGERIEPLTRPHTAWNELVRRGAIDDTNATDANPNLRNVLIYVLGGEVPAPLEIISLTPLPGDRLILTTDGITNHIPDSTILTACRTISDTTCAEAIIEHAILAGSRDNCTCAVIAFEGPETPFRREPPRKWWQLWK